MAVLKGMKRSLPLVALLLAGCFVRAQDGYDEDSSYGAVSVDTFAPSLDPYGAWVVLPRYGRAWQPSAQYVGADFYPYGTGGRWLYTNAGWVFDSEYPFGWAVFHYGRWYRDLTSGWLWIPGRTWGPSWVSWRAGGPYVGWAPLGPRGAPDSDSWCFVPTHRFTTGSPRRYSVGAREFHRAVALTQPVQRRSRAQVGPPPSYVSSATRERIVPVPLTQVPSAGRAPPRERGRFNAPLPRPPGARQPELRQSDRVPTPPPPQVGAERREGFSPPPAGRREPDRREGFSPPPPSGRMEPERREGFSPPPPAPQPMQPNFPRRERPPPSLPQPQRQEQPRFSPPAGGTFNAPPAPPPSQRPVKRSRGAPPPPPPPPRR